MLRQTSFHLGTRPRSFSEITSHVADVVAQSGVFTGMANVFVRHTSCSIVITENADPAARRDLETLAKRWAPDGDQAYVHTEEGADDTSAHARSVLGGISVNVPIGNGRLLLGHWQGIFLWEHREQEHRREVVVTVMGEAEA